MVKNLPARQETWVRSLGWEDSLEKGMATHFDILTWRIQQRGLAGYSRAFSTTDCYFEFSVCIFLLPFFLKQVFIIYTILMNRSKDPEVGRRWGPGVPGPARLIHREAHAARLSTQYESSRHP